MKHIRITFGVAGLLALGANFPSLAADAHHAGHDASPARLQLDQGRKWPTDEPLRQAMTTMRNALAEQLHGIHAGRLGRDDYAALGRTIETQIGAIVSQCKLEPKADAMLHVVVADLAAAADIMQEKTEGKPAAAAHRAVKALNGYGSYFAHPRWAALK